MAIFRTLILLSMTSAILVSGSANGSDAETKTDEKPVEKAPPVELGLLKPVAPAKLLEWLPDCPETWVLKKSQGQTLYQDHLESHAQREYRVFRVPGKDTALPTDVMTITIRDTCGHGPLLNPFRKETSPGKGRDLSLGRWGDYPAILVRVGPRKQSLRLLIADRFILQMVYSLGNNNARAIRPWLSACNLKAMEAAKQETRPPILKKRVTLEIIDELNPKRNRRYSAVATPSDDPPTEPRKAPAAPDSNKDVNRSQE